MNWYKLDKKLREAVFTVAVCLLTYRACHLLFQVTLPAFQGFSSALAPPVPPASGMVLWFKSNCITFSGGNCSVPSDGANVDAWNDKSGNGNRVVYGNGSHNTFHVTGGQNGKPYVLVTNSNNTLLNQIVPSDYSAFIVLKLNGGGSPKQDIFGPGNGGNSSFLYFFTTIQGVDKANIVEVGHATTALGTTLWHQCNVTFANNTNQIVFRIDRTDDALATTAGSANMTTNIKSIWSDGGSGGLLDADIGELILYNRVVLISEKTTIETYFHNEFNL